MKSVKMVCRASEPKAAQHGACTRGRVPQNLAETARWTHPPPHINCCRKGDSVQGRAPSACRPSSATSTGEGVPGGGESVPFLMRSKKTKGPRGAMNAGKRVERRDGVKEGRERRRRPLVPPPRSTQKQQNHRLACKSGADRCVYVQGCARRGVHVCATVRSAAVRSAVEAIREPGSSRGGSSQIGGTLQSADGPMPVGKCAAA